MSGSVKKKGPNARCRPVGTRKKKRIQPFYKHRGAELKKEKGRDGTKSMSGGRGLARADFGILRGWETSGAKRRGGGEARKGV